MKRQTGESNALIHHMGIKKWNTSNHLGLPNGEDTLAGVYLVSPGLIIREKRQEELSA